MVRQVVRSRLAIEVLTLQITRNGWSGLASEKQSKFAAQTGIADCEGGHPLTVILCRGSGDPSATALCSRTRTMTNPMTRLLPSPPATAAFSAKERDYIRGELDMFFSTLPTVAEGFPLKRWVGGVQAGQVKLPPTVVSLVQRGLMRIDATGRMPRAFFTEAGLEALRAMMTDRRFADPAKFAHVRQELGIDGSEQGVAAPAHDASP